MKTGLLAFFISISLVMNAQFAHPYRVFSENGQYFIKSVPFSEQSWTKDGITRVYSTKDTAKALMTIHRYFHQDEIILSNDGKSFCFVQDWSNPGRVSESDAVFFYRKGVLVKKYHGSAFVDTTSEEMIHSLCYRNEDIDSLVLSKGMLIRSGFKKGTDSVSAYLNTNTFFVQNNTIYLLTQNRYVNRFDLRKGKLIDRISFDDYCKGTLIYPQKRIIQEYDIKIPPVMEMPKLADGSDYCAALAKSMKMVDCDTEKRDYAKKYKTYRYNIRGAIDSSGNCVELEIHCNDSDFQKGVEKFIKSAKFDKTEIPRGIEKWYFMHGATFRNESVELAIQERELEILEEKKQYEKRIVAKSIEGVYIPIDLNDCFVQLNKIFKPAEVTKFRNLPIEEAMVDSHFAIGLSLRNNWCLWNGSRLSIYFNNLGITHPDDMSGIILTSYHRYLNKQDIDLDSQIKHYKDYWKNAE